MEHWSNINSTYGRLSSASGIPANAAGINPFDLHVMEQRSFGTAGLGSGLTNPLPAHAAPMPPTRLTSMTHPVNYGTLHGSMAPLFDAFGTSGFSNQAAYRPVGQAIYSLEAVSSHTDTMSRLASVINSQPTRSSSLFNTDLHTMNDSPIQGLPSSAETSDFWSRSGFVPPTGVGSFIRMPSSSASSGKKDPPPAHSGSRPTPAVSTKSRFYHESPPVTQQSAKHDYTERAAVTQATRALASSPPTAHANSQRFEAPRIFAGRTGQLMAGTNDQRYIESTMQMDLNDVMSSDDTSGSVVGHGSFGSCSSPVFPSAGYPVLQKPRSQTIFQPSSELAGSPSCVSNTRSQGAAYGSLAANSNSMLAAYNEFAMSKVYPGSTPIRSLASVDASCGRNIEREESFELSGLLGSMANQSSVSNLLTVQAVADSTTKPKKAASRGSRVPKATRTGRATGQSFDGTYSEEDLLAESLGVTDGRRGRGAKVRKMPENRDLGQGGKNMMEGSTSDQTMFENVDRYLPQMVVPPSGGLGSPVFTQAVSPEGHLPSSLLQPEPYHYASIVAPAKQVHDTQVFLTNICGNSFVNPSELLLKESSSDNYPVIHETSEYASDNNYQLTPKRSEPAAVVDEEFMHLAEAPTSRDCYKKQAEAHCINVGKPKATVNFLDSFVNFLSGKKQETLSSVSSTAVANRPVLPKYIPDTRPRRTEESAGKIPLTESSEKDIAASQQIVTDEDTTVTTKRIGRVASGVPVDSINDVSAMAKTSVSSSFVSTHTDHLNRSLVRAKDEVLEKKGSPALKGRPNPIPARPQPTRKAKTVVEEKRKCQMDGNESSDEDLKVKSFLKGQCKDEDDDYDSDKDPAWKPSNEGLNRKRTPYREDEFETPSKRCRNKRLSTKSEGLPEMVSWALPPANGPNALKSPGQVAEPKPCELASSSQVTAPLNKATHSYQKGDFVIEKKDLKNLTSYFSIWKIDTGRLLQKYEPVTRDGKLMHQAISTYSSWSDDIKENYAAIQVNIVVASRIQEVVEVVGGIKLSEGSSLSGYESLVEPFNIFIQILLSQSLESNFLDVLIQDPDPYYMNPLNLIETSIEEGLNRIRNCSKWTAEFLDMANRMSNYNAFDKALDSIHCQATGDISVPAVMHVKFFGTVYDRYTLRTLEEVATDTEREFAIGVLTQKYLPIYHRLQHLKFALYQRCQTKVNEVRSVSELEDHQVLDTCLQNLSWMKELFAMLEVLLKEANNV